MNLKPIQPQMHGVIDYIFSGVLVVAPAALQVNNKAVRMYQSLGVGFLTVNAFTDTPVGIKRWLSFKQH